MNPEELVINSSLLGDVSVSPFFRPHGRSLGGGLGGEGGGKKGVAVVKPLVKGVMEAKFRDGKFLEVF